MFFAPAIRTTAAAPRLGLLDGAFERFMNDSFPGARVPWHGLEEDDKAWTLSLDVPGIAKEHLRIQVEDRLVRIETAQESRRQFKAVYELPQEVDVDACEAKLENGVLTLKLSKLAQQSNARQIAIG